MECCTHQNVVTGVVYKVVFNDPSSDISIVRINTETGSTSLIGSIPSVFEGMLIEASGQWESSDKYGTQFRCTSVKIQVPSNISALQSYLSSGAIRGLGPVYAQKIIQTFGVHTTHILNHEIERLESIQGIGRKKIDLIKQSWDKQQHICSLSILLMEIGIPQSKAEKIFNIWGADSESIIKLNPYRLATLIQGIGFKTVDNSALALGIDPNSTFRLESAIKFLFTNLYSIGHTCYDINSLIKEGSQLISVDTSYIKQFVDNMISENKLVFPPGSSNLICEEKTFKIEKSIAYNLSRILNCQSEPIHSDIKTSLSLEETQIEAIHASFANKIHVITGGPGTGKTTITRCIIEIALQNHLEVITCAPTGKAAKRMQELTSTSCKTIHNLLEYSFIHRKFQKNSTNTLQCDLIIIDEASMIDTSLMFSLLNAIPSRCRCIFIGDVDQLPSIGAGNILYDIIYSSKLPVTVLTKIFRQKTDSTISKAAQLIKSTQAPTWITNGEFEFIEKHTKEEIISTVHSIISKTMATDPMLQETQVLAAIKKGTVGIENLNQIIQTILTSKQPKIQIGSRYIFKGDKLIQTKNNYKKEVFNGEVLWLLDFDTIEQTAILKTSEGNYIEYLFEEFDQLQLAYALSVHKYQGSQSKCVILPIHSSHFKVLTKKVIYTAITRATNKCIVIGSKKDFWMCVKNNASTQRNTGLCHIIKAFL